MARRYASDTVISLAVLYLSASVHSFLHILLAHLLRVLSTTLQIWPSLSLCLAVALPLRAQLLRSAALALSALLLRRRILQLRPLTALSSMRARPTRPRR